MSYNDGRLREHKGYTVKQRVTSDDGVEFVVYEVTRSIVEQKKEVFATMVPSEARVYVEMKAPGEIVRIEDDE